MKIHSFTIPSEAVLREYSLYIVVSKPADSNPICVYVGKTGDNRKGCNPVISRAGNHFSYNPIHSQVRNKIVKTIGDTAHQKYTYEYFFTHFRPYREKEITLAVAEINELERLLLQAVKAKLGHHKQVTLLNEYKGKLKKINQIFHTIPNLEKIDSLVDAAGAAIKKTKRRAR